MHDAIRVITNRQFSSLASTGTSAKANYLAELARAFSGGGPAPKVRVVYPTVTSPTIMSLTRTRSKSE